MDFEFDSKDIERLRRVGPLDSDAIFLCGSMVEGFANRQSDIDVLVIYHGESDPDRNFTRIYTAEKTGQRVQIECLSVERIIAIHEELLRLARPGTMTGPADIFRPGGAEFYYRCLTGVAVDGTEASCLAVSNLLSIELFQAVYSEHCRQVALAALARHAGAVIAELEPVAVDSLRMAVLWGAAAALAQQGEAYPGYKWIFEKVARRHGKDSELYRTLWDLKGIGSRNLAEYRADVFRFLRSLDVGLSNSGVAAADDPRLTAHPNGSLFVIEGAYYIVVDKTRLFLLSEVAVKIWQLLAPPTGRPLARSELLDRVAGIDRIEAGRVINEMIRKNVCAFSAA